MSARSLGEKQTDRQARTRRVAPWALITLIALAALLAVQGPTPAAQAQETGYRQVSAGGYHTCAVTFDGTVICWGGNGYGQSTPPVDTFTQVSAGEHHTCGLTTSGHADCWGANAYLQATDHLGPFAQISAGYEHSCVLTPGGSVTCWGRNDFGQATYKSGPFTQLTAGQVQNCGLKSSGFADCWGADDWGQGTDQAGPFTQVSAGGTHNCAVRQSDGSVDCWGYNNHGQATDQSGSFVAVSAGHMFTCGLKTDGTLACWGYNFYGQVKDTPTGTYKQVDAGQGHACAITQDDQVICWGRNDHGQATVPMPTGPGVHYEFNGFYPPVNPEPALNAVKAGSAVPLKFSLGGDQGLNVIAPDYPASQPLDCASFDPGGALAPVQPAGGSGLSYDAASDQYAYVWKTEKAWAGTCRVLALQLSDGTEHLAAFRFK